jgi:hypothetical protein
VKPSFPITPPERLFSRAEVLQRPSPVPTSNGLYAWYFREVPPVIPTDGCLTVDGKTLLYLGIAPDKANKPNIGASLLSRMARIRTYLKDLHDLYLMVGSYSETDNRNFPINFSGQKFEMGFLSKINRK